MKELTLNALVKFHENVDPYDFRDNFNDFEEAKDYFCSLSINEHIVILDNIISNDEDYTTEIIEEAKALKEKLLKGE